MRAAASAERLERDVARLERRVRGRSESLARQFDRVLRVLEAWGYVEGWSLTEWGEMLARLYTEADLLVAESLREGLLDDLGPSEIAAMVSCFTYERRGRDGAGPLPPGRWPTRELATRWRAVERIAQELNHNEDDAGLPETRALDPGFVPYVHDWVAGEDLADVLEDDRHDGGRLRASRQAVHRPSPPDRRRRAEAGDRGDGARRRGRLLPRRDRGVERGRRVTRPLRHGEPWGHTATGPPDVEVAGDDADLVAAAVSRPGALVRFRPTPRSDLARALGLGSDGSGATEVAIDALAIDPDDSAVDRAAPSTPSTRSCSGGRRIGCGGPPAPRDITVRVDGRAWFSGRATTVVVANGQFLRGADLVPRGHPGDGWAEVQVYALGRRARRRCAADSRPGRTCLTPTSVPGGRAGS